MVFWNCTPDIEKITVLELLTPAQSGSAEPNLVSDGENVYLSWIHTEDTLNTLYFSALTGRSWSPPVAITSGTDWFVTWADFPSMAVANTQNMVAHYLEKSGEGTFAYDVKLALSIDGGASWTGGLKLHDDTTQTEHGFASLLPLADDLFGAVWLDGRNTGGGHDHGSSRGAMTLRYAEINSQGFITNRTLLDDRICDCCQTSAVKTNDGVIAVYRDRSEDEIRDIYYTKQSQGQWTTPKPVYDDNWKIAGCPVNGPSIDYNDGLTAVAWFTGANDQPMVKLSLSHDDGNSFDHPVQVDDGKPAGRVDVLALSSDRVLVSWVEARGEGAVIRLKLYDRLLTLLSAEDVSPISPVRASGFPRMVKQGGHVVMAWTVAGENSMIQPAIVQF